MMGAFLNQGQVCAAASRVYIEGPIFDQIVGGLSQAVRSLSVGPGLDPAAQVNPLVSASHQRKVQGFLEEARKSGAELIEGARATGSMGFYVSPTLLVNPDSKLRLVKEEVFGPVLALTRVADAEEAVRLANDSVYGLAASLWTRDLKSTLDLVPRIQAGTVWVNSHVPIDPNLPFGGFKQSGIGRDFGPRWLEGYTEEKAVCIAH
jgi:phenylacetaldehyde dehydrogenase